eukprot:TRINITY_DN12849_c0_g1_i1.p1 TRINITY_DN12849_c0_g1~~TRINITY_DN12849_c0_g1_i1.p1  ORF type:complete len:356 (+),score=41.47 TRINITY_DN12849_c0_g1_i1:60-1127(+)
MFRPRLTARFLQLSKASFSTSLPPYKVLFFGTGDIIIPCLQALNQNQSLVSRLELVTPPDKPHGRRMKVTAGPAKEYAISHNIAVHQPPPEVDFRLNGWDLPKPHPFDIGVVFSFGYFIPSRIITSFPLGMINIHPSLLPKYRGSAPLQHALLAGDTETGISIIEVHPERMDAGAVLLQRRHPIAQPHSTFASLSQEISQLSAQMVVQALQELPHLRQVATPQTLDTSSSRAPKIKKGMDLIDWKQSSAEQAYRTWQALSGSSFRPHTNFRSQRLNLITLQPIQHNASSEELAWPPGTFTYDSRNHLIRIRCKPTESGPQFVGCTQLQLATKNVCSALDFVQNHNIGKKGVASFD